MATKKTNMLKRTSWTPTTRYALYEIPSNQATIRGVPRFCRFLRHQRKRILCWPSATNFLTRLGMRAASKSVHFPRHFEGLLSAGCCRSKVADEGRELCWSNPMQPPGQRYCKRVVKWNAILQQLPWLVGRIANPPTLRKTPAAGPIFPFAKTQKTLFFANGIKAVIHFESKSYAAFLRCMGCKRFTA